MNDDSIKNYRDFIACIDNIRYWIDQKQEEVKDEKKKQILRKKIEEYTEFLNKLEAIRKGRFITREDKKLYVDIMDLIDKSYEKGKDKTIIKELYDKLKEKVDPYKPYDEKGGEER